MKTRLILLIFALASLGGNKSNAQSAKFLLKGGFSYSIPLWGSSDYYRERGNLSSFGLGTEFMVNHDISMEVLLSIYTPFKSNYVESNGNTISETNLKRNITELKFSPFIYNFTQSLNGLYWGVDARLMLVNGSEDFLSTHRITKEVLSRFNRDYSDFEIGLGAKVGYKAWINDQFGFDINSFILASEDVEELGIGLNLNVLYKIK